MTGSANPAPTSMSPTSCMSAKRLTCAWRSTSANARAELLQRVGAERRERHEPADLQHPVDLGERRGRSPTHCSARLLQTRSNVPVANGSAAMSPQTKRASSPPRPPVNVAKTRASAERRSAGLRARRRRASAARCRARRTARARIADARSSACASPVPQPASRICGGRELHDVEPLGHPRADLLLQDRGGVVGRRGAREMAAHRARDRARPGSGLRGGSAAIEESRRAHRRTPRRARGTARARRRAIEREARVRQMIGEPAARGGKRQRVATAGQ